LEARRADLIHCHTFAFALGGDVAKALGGPPLVVTVHSSHFLRLAGKKLMRLPLRLLLGKAAVLLSTSKEIDQVVRCLLPKTRTLPIVNGIDTDTFRPVEPSLAKVENEFLLVCPRRLVPKNGVEFLVRALGYLKDRLKVRLYIAGDGPLRRHLERVAADLGVLDRIVFKGDVPNTDMPAIYSSADLVVIPSLIEATSIAALEAMSCQRLVAASRVGGLPEIIDSRVGILFEPASPQAIAAAIVKAAGLHEASAMGMEARRRVEESWSIRRMTDIHEELYEALIKEAPAA
jgi:glycosyltransferase involved in cell wall biosynthesis